MCIRDSIYAKVGDEVARLDDTTVDLSNYATIDQLNAVSGGIGGTVYACLLYTSRCV